MKACSNPKPERTVSVPVADLRALVDLSWEMIRQIERTDRSATGSIYGIEYADRTTARVAALLPIRPPPLTPKTTMTPDEEKTKIEETLRAVNKWIEDAKPLLARGGDFEHRVVPDLQRQIVELKRERDDVALELREIRKGVATAVLTLQSAASACR